MNMTLKDFLLARIEEQEVASTLREVHNQDCEWIPNSAGYSYPCECGVPEWMKADAEAKRRIITIHGNGEAWCDHCSDWGNEPSDMCPTLRALAAVYSDAPDYQPEWSDTEPA